MFPASLFEGCVQFSYAVAAIAADWLLQSTVLLAAGLVAGWTVRARGAAVQSVVYRATLAAILACPIVSLLLATSGVPGLHLTGAATSSPSPSTDAATAMPITSAGDGLIANSPQHSEPDRVERRESRGGFGLSTLDSGLSTPDSNARPVPQPGVSLDWSAILVCAVTAAWLLGSGVLLVRVLLSWRLTRQLLRTTHPADLQTSSDCRTLARELNALVPAVLRSPFVSSPSLVGVFRPAILLPEQEALGAANREILVHELAHLARGDVLWSLLGRIATAVLFYQPLVWLLARRIVVSAEQVCDDYVVQLGFDRPGYARRLVDVAQRYQAAPAIGVGVISLRSWVGRRVVRILDSSRRLSTRAGRRVGCCVAAAFIVATFMVGLLGIGGSRADERRTADASTPSTEDAQSPGKTLVTGQVLDERGKPVAGAQVAVLGRTRRLEVENKTLGVATADAQGRYRLAVPGMSSATYYEVSVIALAPGHALGSQPVGLDVKQPEVVIRLPDEQVLRGRVVDPKGFPAAKAKVCVRGVEPKEKNSYRGVFLWEPQDAPPVWPQPATTDALGRFTLHGVNTSAGTHVEVVDHRFARWHFRIGRPGSGVSAAEARVKHPSMAVGGDFVPQASPADEVTLAPPPSQIIEGQVLCEDTKQPAAHARVSAYARAEEELGSAIGVFGQADGQGRFRLNPFPGLYFEVAAHPAQGEPYLIRQKTFPWPERTEVYRVEVAVPRGVLVRGKITESPSGKPVAGADIQYEPRSENHKKGILTGWQGAVVSRDDGTFQIAVPPGKGTLVVQGPPGYVFDVVGSRQIASGFPGGRRYYLHAMIPLDLDPKATPEVHATLKRGVTVRGRLVGPDDKPVAEAVLSSYLDIAPFDREWSVRSPLVIRGGEFEVHGVDPEKPAPVYILDPKDQWGAKAGISGRTAREPLVVRLLPCGSAEVRFIDTEGNPVVGRQETLNIVFTPGASRFVGPAASEPGELQADEVINANFDRMHYWGGIRTDKDGRCLLPALIPGAAYRLYYESPSGENQVLDFRAESGKTLKLPDVVVKKRADGRAE
jgi:beta-lactamase regulating signal transducer with metallopeptidase domain